MSTEKSRNLMLKGSTPLSSSSQQHHSNTVPLNVLRGVTLISQLDSQKYPTTFSPCSSDFDNNILPVAPNIPQLKPDPTDSSADNVLSSSD